MEERYCAVDGERVSRVVSFSGRDQGYFIKVAKFSFSGLEFDSHIVDAFSLPEDIGIDCLIGNDILDKYHHMYLNN